MKKFFLSALVDFPDDANSLYDEQSLDAMAKTLREIGVKRVHWQWYPDLRDGYFWENSAPVFENAKKTAQNLPEMNRSFVKAAKKYGLETVAVMRPLEGGNWPAFSPWYPHVGKRPGGIPHIGGDVRWVTYFLLDHPEMRVKRRSFDIDPNAKNKTIGSVKLYKQNDYLANIRKEDIVIYVSGDNSRYRRYEGDFTFAEGKERCGETVVTENQVFAKKDELIVTLTLGGLNIKEQYAALAVTGREDADPAGQFCNTAYGAIRCFDPEGSEICATPGQFVFKFNWALDPLECGFNFDDGFGDTGAIVLDRPGATEYIAISKGKNGYLPGTLCEWEPEVQKYWFSQLEQALDEDFDMYSNRIECHSAMTDEPYAYGYNDCIKKEYEKRFGPCDEQNIDSVKLAEIRGDKFSEIFAEGARKVRERGKKIVAMLNLEMLHKPIPYSRRLAYPMNVDWQWRRWLDETRPDAINLRTFTYTPEFVFNDPQSMAIINTAKQYGVPLIYERYVSENFPAEYKRIKDTGLFSSCILYEVCSVMKSDGNGGVTITQPEMINELQKNLG